MRSAAVGVYELVTGPAAEPVTLSEAKAHARVDVDDDDGVITDLITAAREWVEQNTGRCLITQTWRLSLDMWPGSRADDWWDGAREGPITLLDAAWVEFRRSPVIAFSRVATLDETGTETTWASSNYYLSREPNGYGRLVRKRGVVWPDVSNRDAGAIRIEATCGYGPNAADVPFPIRQAVKQLVAYWYENRDAVGEAPARLATTLATYRVMR